MTVTWEPGRSRSLSLSASSESAMSRPRSRGGSAGKCSGSGCHRRRSGSPVKNRVTGEFYQAIPDEPLEKLATTATKLPTN